MKIDLLSSVLLVVDIQEKLLPVINEKEQVLSNCIKLIQGAKCLDMNIIVTEQYPKGIGATINEIASLFDDFSPMEKTMFSCIKEKLIHWEMLKAEPSFGIICGIEAHICVLQTVIDLKTIGVVPVLVTDCIGSRFKTDKDMAIKRAMYEGAIVTTYEALLFELLEGSKHTSFKEVSALIKDRRF